MLYRLRIGLTLCVSLVACGGQDPILERAEQIREQGGPSAGETPGPSPMHSSVSAAGSGVEPPPGIPEEPARVDPDAREIGTPVPGEPEAPPPMPIGVNSGPSVRLSGNISVVGDFAGTVLIRPHGSDPLVPPHDILGPGISIEFPEETTFVLDVPMGQAIFLEAFMDLGERNGRPNEGEPMMASSDGITTASDVADISIELAIQPHRPAPEGAPENPDGP